MALTPAEKLNRPLTPDEIRMQVRRIWQEVLELDQTIDQQNFLDAGGDSLSAMLFISRLRMICGVEFTIEDLFMEDATVGHLIEDVLAQKGA